MARIAANIVAELCRRITAGELRPGDPVPTGRDIAREQDVSVSVVYHALARLRQDGLAERAPDGTGLYVTERAPAIAATWRPPNWRGAPREEDADPLYLAQVVRTAIDIADADGLATMSMRRIGERLNTANVTISKHVQGRAHLLTLMADAAFAEHPPPPRPAGDWRAQLEILYRHQWQMYRARPWLAEAVWFRRPQLCPHVAAHAEYAAAALEPVVPAAPTRANLVATAANYVRGSAMNLDRLPAEAGEDDPDTVAFESGLQRLLDGFARLIP
ncbi:MAG TPA: winged helix-turn-helix domain-containing protein [Dactylosporangium sp.]|nr:winged helix-turn-helix domain-containing protein [Dactylosporangium sp.]